MVDSIDRFIYYIFDCGKQNLRGIKERRASRMQS